MRVLLAAATAALVACESQPATVLWGVPQAPVVSGRDADTAGRAPLPAAAPLQVQISKFQSDLNCRACAVLLARPQGGTPPYTCTWSDPSLVGCDPHQVCPTATTTYAVTVTDSSLAAQPSGIVKAAHDLIAVPCIPDTFADAGSAQPTRQTCIGHAAVDLQTECVKDSVGLTTEISSTLASPLLAGQRYTIGVELGDFAQLSGTYAIDLYLGQLPCQPLTRIGSVKSEVEPTHPRFCVTPQQDSQFLIAISNPINNPVALPLVSSVAVACEGCNQE